MCISVCVCVCVCVWWGLGTNVKSSPPLPSCYLYCLRQACGFGRHWKSSSCWKTLRSSPLFKSRSKFHPSTPYTCFKIALPNQTVHILEVKTYFHHWKCNQIPLSTEMMAHPCVLIELTSEKWGESVVNEKNAAQLHLEMMSWGCETLQNPTHPPHWLVNSFLPGWALPAIDSTPPPLLCSVIQTWKVNNKLTSSLVCIFLWCSQTSNLLKADHLCLRNRYGLKMSRNRKSVELLFQWTVCGLTSWPSHFTCGIFLTGGGCHASGYKISYFIVTIICR